jgi:hypothetical protein
MCAVRGEGVAGEAEGAVEVAGLSDDRGRSAELEAGEQLVSAMTVISDAASMSDFEFMPRL